MITNPDNKVLKLSKLGKILPPGGKADINDNILTQSAIRGNKEEAGKQLDRMELEPPLYIAIFEVDGVKMLDFGFWFKVNQPFDGQAGLQALYNTKAVLASPKPPIYILSFIYYHIHGNGGGASFF